jgi:2'-hydroxyisoflavone reductase
MKRREFLKLSAATMLVAPLMAASPGSLKILVLGGTGFLGPHQVEEALGRGHQVTIFNRGKTSPEMFAHLENLVGDRDNDLKALEGRKWDAVIDNSGFLPRWVKQSCELLRGSVPHYLYTSSLSIYADNTVIGQTENGKLRKLADPTTEERSPRNYGGMKALSEEYVKACYPETSSLVRAGLVVGPGDPTDRFTYWPVRLFRGGEVLAPGTPDDPIQCIDVRDLARWTVQALERRHFGTYNLTGPYRQLTMGSFLQTVRKAVNSSATITWTSAKFLERERVSPWTDLPLWVPPDSDYRGFVRVDVSKAVKAGLTFTPMATTVQDSLAWYRTLDQNRALRAGLSAQRELELLTKWREEHEK